MIISNKKTYAVAAQQTLRSSLEDCPFFRAILMLLVILYHSCVFWTNTWWDSPPVFPSVALNYIARWLNSFHIYCFTLISGYVFAYKVKRNGYNVFPLFLRNKAKRLLVPYVFITFMWLIPINLLLFSLTWEKLVKTYLLGINPEQLWFLLMLFGVFAIVWPLRKIIMKRPPMGWLIAIVSYGIGIVGKRLLPNIFCIWTACQYVPYFYLGMRIRIKEENGESKITEVIPWFGWVGIDAILFVGSILLSEQSGTIWSLMKVGLNFFLHIVGAIMAWTTLQIFANKVNWGKSKSFKTLSSYSMPMYLFHQQIIYFTITCLNGKVAPWIHAGLNFAAALIGSFLISAVLMRWKVTRLLIGEK